MEELNQIHGHDIYKCNKYDDIDKVFNYTNNKYIEQLRYHLEMDAAEEARKRLLGGLDFDHDLWGVQKVNRHKRDKGSKRMMIQVDFKNNGESNKWIDMNSLVIQDPIPIISYIHKNHLQRHKDFSWIIRLLYNGEHESLLRKSFNIMRKPYEKKFRFGVQVPKGTKEAYFLDLQNGNTLWQEAIAKELKQLHDFKTFIILERDEEAPVGYSRIPYHIVYDVKWDGRRKARLVANCNMVDPCDDDINSWVVSFESLRIGFLIS